MIRCRLPTATLGDLGRFLGTSHERTEGPYFIIRERNRPQDSQQVLIPPETLSRLMFKRQWQLNSLQILVSNPAALTEIVLCIKKNEEFPISGFPRTIQDEDPRSSKLCCPPFPIFSNEFPRAVGIRPTPSTANQRWRSRTASQQNRRKKWTEPTAPLALMNNYDSVNSLSSYSRPDYLVGNSTPQALADVRDRLGHDLAPMPAELSAVEGLIYEMADTSVPVELEASIPIIVPQVIVEDDDAPSAHAMPRKPPKVYYFQDSIDVSTSQPGSASRAVPGFVPEDSSQNYQNESATVPNNNELFYHDIASPYAARFNASTNSFGSGPDYSSSSTTLTSRSEGLTSTTTFDSILEEQSSSTRDPKKKDEPVKSPTRKGFRKMFR
jgi:hypothetical protein